MQKIYQIDELINVLKKQNKQNAKIVLCHGVFDLLHIGHIKHFRKQRKWRYTNSTITPDKYVNKDLEDLLLMKNLDLSRLQRLIQ